MRKDIEGLRFGRLIAETWIPGRNKWLCSCDCGAVKEVRTHSLTSGCTKSCGCLRREVSAQRATRHGCCGEKLYAVWNMMKQRCSNSNQHDYHYYGGRGIRVCNEWLNDYAAFRTWALANGYEDGLTIDRVNTYGDYTPENCRWITIQDQQKNRRPPIRRTKDDERRED